MLTVIQYYVMLSMRIVDYELITNIIKRLRWFIRMLIFQTETNSMKFLNLCNAWSDTGVSSIS